MRGLTIKREWLEKIVQGKKRAEVRRTSTSIRGDIALVESKTALVWAIAELYNVRRVSASDIGKYKDTHDVPEQDLNAYLRDKEYAFLWQLRRIRVIHPQTQVRRPCGAVNWIHVDPLLLTAV
jgi:predicted transcriptional regulator